MTTFNTKQMMDMMNIPMDHQMVCLPKEIVDMLRMGQFAKLAMQRGWKLRVIDGDVEIPNGGIEDIFLNAKPADGLAYPGRQFRATYFMFIGPARMQAFPGQSPSYEFANIGEEDARQWARQDANQPWTPVAFTPIAGVFPAVASVTINPNAGVGATAGRSLYGYTQVTLPTQLNDNGPYMIQVRVQADTNYTDQTPGPFFDSTLVPFTIYRGTVYTMICIAFVRSTVTGQLTPLVQLSSFASPAAYFLQGPATTMMSLRGSHTKDDLIWHPAVDPNPDRS